MDEEETVKSAEHHVGGRLRETPPNWPSCRRPCRDGIEAGGIQTDLGLSHPASITFPFWPTCRKCAAAAHVKPSARAHPLMSLSTSPSLSTPAPAWMSWWDSYLAPGDLRRRQQQSPATPPTPPSTTTTNNGTPDTITPTPSHLPAHPGMTPAHRARRQNALFLGGLTFTLLSLALTRRTVLRKRLAAYPATFTPSHMHIAPPPGPHQQMTRVEGSLMAIEALGLATLNVCSVFMAGIGGAMVWFDVAEVEDLRRKVGDGGEVYGGVVDEEAEREVEGWIANAFGQGQGQKGALGAGDLGQGVLGKLQELQKEKSEKGGEED